jgi:hypothetical protein
MKTLRSFLLIIISLVTGSIGFSQIQQGSFRVGGGASLSQAVYDNNNSYLSFSMSPAVAYFPVNNFSIGLAFPLSTSTWESGTNEYSTSRYSFGPELRYYFPFGKWAAFPEVSYTFGKTTSESYGVTSGDPVLYKSETKFRSIQAGAGITCFLNTNIGVEAIVFYKNNEQEFVNPFATLAYEKSINFSIGFQIYLNRK